MRGRRGAVQKDNLIIGWQRAQAIVRIQTGSKWLKLVALFQQDHKNVASACIFFFSQSCLFFSWFLMSLGSFCRLCRLKRRLKQDRIMQVGGKMWNIRAWACCSGHRRLKLNIKAVKSVKGPTRAGCGSFAISLSVSSMFWDFIRTQRLLWTQGKVWDERVSGSVKRTVEISMFRSAFRAHPASKRPEIFVFFA